MITRSICTALALCGAAMAQDSPDLSRLRQAMAGMLELGSFAFESTVDGKSPVTGHFQIAGGAAGRIAVVKRLAAGDEAETPVVGVWTPEMLFASCNDGGDQMVFAGRRMIARRGDGAWLLRKGRLADGEGQPFFPDPEALMDFLQATDLEILRSRVGTREDRPIQIVTATVPAKAAAEMAWAGLLPGASPNLGGGKPDITVDIAFYLDPATRQLHEMKLRSIEAGGGGARAVFVAVAGGAQLGIQKEEAEEKEAEQEGDDGFRDDLPVRETDGKSVVQVRLIFSEHGTAEVPEIGDAGRALLGIR